MSLKKSFNGHIFQGAWHDKVIEADSLWSQVEAMLKARGLELPRTERRPDVRMIVNNVSGADVSFHNPANHSNHKPEIIPGTGDKTAAMIMVKGATLEEQRANAQTLYSMYKMGTLGLSEIFLKEMAEGKLAHLVDEAYGPAPYAGQSEKLVDVAWTQADGYTASIAPVKGAAASFGARAATTETVFTAQFNIYVAGTGTTPEMVEGAAMNIAVASDWQTGKASTRPIVPSVAKVYYGDHYAGIPSVSVHPDGIVKSIDLKNGQTVNFDDPDVKASVKAAKRKAPKV